MKNIINALFIGSVSMYSISGVSQDALDPTFAVGGILDIKGYAGENTHFHDFTFDQQGRILVIAECYSQNQSSPYDPTDLCIYRIGKDGKVDASFVDHGLLLIRRNVYTRDKSKILIDSSGRVIVKDVCFNSDNGRYLTCIRRFTETGIVDETFGVSGVKNIIIDGTPLDSSIDNFQVVKDGKFVLKGSFYDRNDIYFSPLPFLVRYTKDWVLDTTYGVAGVAKLPPETYDGFGAAAWNDGDQIVSVGTHSAMKISETGALLKRLTSNDFMAEIPRDPGIYHWQWTAASKVAFDNLGRPLLMGMAFGGNYYSVVRMTDGFDVDTTFGNSGVTYVSPFDCEWVEHCVNNAYDVEYSLGGIFIAGDCGRYDMPAASICIVRIDSAGRPDGLFGINGVVALEADAGVYTGGTSSGNYFKLRVGVDGKLYLFTSTWLWEDAYNAKYIIKGYRISLNMIFNNGFER